MIQKEINLPKFKVWHLLLVGAIAFLVWTNIVQKLSVIRLQDDKKELVEKNKSNTNKVAGLNTLISNLEDKVKQKDVLITNYEQKVNYYKYKVTENEKKYQKAIADYNSLNRSERHSATRELLHE